MRRYRFLALIMASIFLLSMQAQAQEETAADPEEGIIVMDEDPDSDVIEPEPMEKGDENGISEDDIPDGILIEEEELPKPMEDIPLISFEEGGEILLDDPMSVEDEIIKGNQDEILLRGQDYQAMRYGRSYTGLFADQLQPDSRDFYDGMAGYYAEGEGDGSWTRTYSIENAPASLHTEFFSSGDSYTFIRTNDSGDYTAEYRCFLEDTAVVVQSAIDAFEYDYPDVYWIRPKSFRYGLTLVADEETIGSEQVTGTVYVTQITYVPEEAFPDARGYLSEYRAGKERALEEITQGADYDGDGNITHSEYLLADHDYLCSLLWYDAEGYRNRKKTGDYSILTPAQTFLGSFRHGAVCEGYAKSFKSLCDAQGIECCLIGGSGHMWNGVYLGGEWHLVDCTWDDDDDGYSHDYLMTGKDTVHTSSGNFSGSSHTTVFCYPELSNSPYHDYALTESVQALCDESGRNTYTCLFCGGSFSVEVQPVWHEYEKTEEEASCTQKGCITYTCVRCGDSWSEEIPALGHDYEERTVAPTCTQAGYTEHTCRRCGDSFRTDSIPALGHDFEKSVTPPSCEEGGYTKYSCRRCGYSFTGDRTQPSGHTFFLDEKASPPSTCMKKGVRRYRCRACGKTRKEEIPLIGHTYRISRVEPSCIREGYTVQTCTVCGYSLKTEKKSALGHDYQETRVSPTIQSGGYVRHTCRRCGDTFTSDHTAPLIAPQAVQNENPGVIQPALSNTISAPLIASPGRIESTDVIVISKAPVLKNVKRKGKSNITITWKKNRKAEKKIKGYEIQVCENSAFTGDVCLYRMKRGKYKKTIKGKRKRTYFIRIRYYCQEGYSAWSSIKKVRLR